MKNQVKRFIKKWFWYYLMPLLANISSLAIWAWLQQK